MNVVADAAMRISQDAGALARDAAQYLCDRANASTGRFAVCLSGGSTPKGMFEVLGGPAYQDSFPWARTHWFFGDERFVPQDDPASNFGMARRAFLGHVPAPKDQIHPIPTDLPTPQAAAAAYDRLLKAYYGGDTIQPGRPLFDLAFQGLGEDGHTASLLPGEPVLAERIAWVAAVPHGREQARITLTYPALDAAQTIVFLLAGAGKRDILRRLRGNEADLPAATLRPQGEMLFLVDQAAAG